MRSLSLLLLLALFRPLPAFAQALIVEFSDSQSEYSRLPDFLRSLHRLRTDYLRRVPNGKLILVVNGDFNGASRFALDEGRLGYAALSALANHWEIVMTIGNHEAFDWGGAHGAKVFLDQIRGLQRVIESRGRQQFRVIAANITPGEDAADIFAPYQDVELASGARVRFVGLVLERFFSTSAYNREQGPKVINDVGDMARALLPLLRDSVADGLSQVFLVVHDRTARVRNLLEQVQSWMGSRPSRPQIAIPIAFTGHDNSRAAELVGNTLLINGGSLFEFATVELNDKGEPIAGPNFFPRERQRMIGLAPPTLSALGSVIQHTMQLLRNLNSERNEVIMQTGGFSARNHTLTRHRLLLGTAIADAMVIWAGQYLSDNQPEALEGRLGTLAFFNSTAYRRDTAIPAGNFTVEALRTIQPVPSRGFGIFRSSGPTIQALYTELRRRQDREGFYTPQISGNLRELRGFQLEFFDGESWSPVRDHREDFLLVVDSTLRLNQYGLPMWRNFLRSSEGSDLHVEPEVDSVTALRRSLVFCEQFVRGDGEILP